VEKFGPKIDEFARKRAEAAPSSRGKSAATLGPPEPGAEKTASARSSSRRAGTAPVAARATRQSSRRFPLTAIRQPASGEPIVIGLDGVILLEGGRGP
jgi:hypothetical protein